MSVVTDTILLYDLAELEEEHFLFRVNEFFGDQLGFVHVEDQRQDWYGGSKMLQANVAIGAFNHLDFEALVKHIRSLDEEFQQITWCQIVAQGECNQGFGLTNVFMPANPCYLPGPILE